MPEFVPAAYAETTLGQAVTRYNASHFHKITMHVVSGASEGVDGAMYHDLLERALRIMGPEDYAASIQKAGWPYIVIARQDTLDANPAGVWGYVLDHEFEDRVSYTDEVSVQEAGGAGADSVEPGSVL